jgi:hypothetical protein
MLHRCTTRLETEREPGLTLFRGHQQLHMDYGYMALFDYV